MSPQILLARAAGVVERDFPKAFVPEPELPTRRAHVRQHPWREELWHRPDFIGRLESIGSDWGRMCALHGCPERLNTYGKLNEHMGQHPETSSDHTDTAQA